RVDAVDVGGRVQVQVHVGGVPDAYRVLAGDARPAPLHDGLDLPRPRPLRAPDLEAEIEQAPEGDAAVAVAGADEGDRCRELGALPGGEDERPVHRGVGGAREIGDLPGGQTSGGREEVALLDREEV